MAKTTTAVVYPAVGFMGAAALIRVHGKTVEEVRAMGRTDRARFDLAVEVVARRFNGVAEPQVIEASIPADLIRQTWAAISAR
jgi:hypothetical protein